MSYTALYRRFRPLDFDEMVGQVDVLNTLKNQVLNSKIGHAYIFSGTRGTGKTSAAKIFARAINCMDPKGYNPCNQCESCVSILEETSMDVIEMDAASHNGVDDIRDIRENVKFPPTRSKFKVYIIDEVHMLSTGAFNALLKTLEEPPQYMVFLLATTEHHKIPATIQSRCQKFEFRRISQSEILKRLTVICQNAGIVYEEEALRLLLNKADGSVRDCLSLVDQVYEPEKGLTVEHVRSVLGYLDNDVLTGLCTAILKQELTEVLITCQDIIQGSKPIQQVIRDMAEFYRNLLLLKSGDSLKEFIDADERLLDRLDGLKNELQIGRLITLIEGLADLENRLKWSSSQRISFEAGMAALCIGSKQVETAKGDGALLALTRRVEQLESQLNRVAAGNTSRGTNDDRYQAPIRSKSAQTVQPAQSAQPRPQAQEGELKPWDGEATVIDFARITENWDKALLAIKKVKVTAHALISEAKPWSFSGNALLLAFPTDCGFHMDALMRDDNRVAVEQALSHFYKAGIRIQCDYIEQLKENHSQQAGSDDKMEDMMEFFEGLEDKLEIIKE